MFSKVIDQYLFNDQIYSLGMIVKGLIEAMGMMSENMSRQHKGLSMAYSDEDFFKLIEENGIHHNAIIGKLYQGE